MAVREDGAGGERAALLVEGLTLARRGKGGATVSVGPRGRAWGATAEGPGGRGAQA
jgi:hypothetical protein